MPLTSCPLTVRQPPLYPRHGVPGASRGSHFGGRSCFQSLYRADVGGSDGDLPKRQVQAGFQPAMQRYLKEHQRDFMPEDTKAGMIQAYLDKYTGSMVCSKQLYKEALNHAFDEPKQWEIREINEIMNQCISGWRYFPNPRMFPNMADKRAGSVKTRQRTYATRLKKRGMVLWRSQNRWSFHSENDSPLHPLLLSRCRAGCRGKSLISGFSPL